MKKWLFPVLLAHVACCGAILLAGASGATVLAALGAYLGDPVVIAVAGLVIAALAIQWFRGRRGIEARPGGSDKSLP